MTARDRTLLLKVVGDIDDAARQLDRLESKQNKFVGAAKKAGLALAGAFAAAKVADFAGSIVTAGAQLAAFEDTARTVFGGVSEQALEAARNAEQIGLSRRQALEQLNYLGNLAQATGATADEALRLSEQTLQLGADFAAFADVPTADVLDAIASATRGEFDALQRYLPTASAATLQEIARTEGLIAEGEALTGAAALQAVYALAVRDGGAALGSAEREADSLQATTARLRARWDNFTASMGQRVLPIVERAALFFEQKLAPAIAVVVDFVARHWPPIYERYIRPTMERVRDLIVAVIELVQEIWARWGDRITAIVQSVGAVIGAWVSAVVDHFGAVIDFLTAVFRGDWAAAWDALLDIAQNFLDFFIELPGRLLNLVGDIVAAVLDVGGQIGRGLVNGIIRAWNALDPSVSFSVPSWVPGIGGRGWSSGDLIPDIPYLAHGGIVTGPTLAMLGEAGNPEAVIPLPAWLGNTYNISVTAGISDPTAVADTIIELIRDYDSRNGIALRDAG